VEPRKKAVYFRTRLQFILGRWWKKFE